MNFINILTRKNTIEITEYIDPYNMEHIKACAVLNKTGVWPKNFIPKNVTLGNNWQTILAYKLSKVWIEQVLAGNVNGMPPIEHTK